jgi:hypothetical protein
MWHGKQDFESSVIMGPRLRGDDAERVGRAVPRSQPKLYTEAFLPKK